jgi:DNA-binding HxlR family transcriptional regulator
MRRTRFDDALCPIARTTDLIGDWWTPIVMRDLMYGVRRFDDLQERLQISRATLAQRLDRLVAEKMLTKVAYQEHPPRFEYHLTQKGFEFWDVLAAMWRFGEDWMFDGAAPVMLTDKATGNPVRPVVVDANTGERINLKKMKIRRNPAYKPSTVPPADPGSERAEKI